MARHGFSQSNALEQDPGIGVTLDGWRVLFRHVRHPGKTASAGTHVCPLPRRPLGRALPHAGHARLHLPRTRPRPPRLGRLRRRLLLLRPLRVHSRLHLLRPCCYPTRVLASSFCPHLPRPCLRLSRYRSRLLLCLRSHARTRSAPRCSRVGLGRAPRSPGDPVEPHPAPKLASASRPLLEYARLEPLRRGLLLPALSLPSPAPRPPSCARP